MKGFLDSLLQPGTWAGALLIAVSAIFVAPLIARLSKAMLLWIPKSIGSGFKAAWLHYKLMTKAKADPVGAVSYVGRQLGLLVMHATIFLTFLGVIAVMQIVDPQWLGAYHGWTVIVCALGSVVYGFRGARVVFALMFFCEMINNPPPEDAQIKIGKNFAIGPFKGVKPPPKPVTETIEQSSDAGSNGVDQQ